MLPTEKQKERTRKEQAKFLLTDMGVICVKNILEKKYFFLPCSNIHDDYESMMFRLKSGIFVVNKQLQKDWTALGEYKFQIKVVEIVRFDPKNKVSDYARKVQSLVQAHKDKVLQKEQQLY